MLKVDFSLVFENVDYAQLEQENKLESLAEDLQRAWAAEAGVPLEAVVVTLRQGSLITEIEIRFVGEEKMADAETLQQGVEDYAVVVDVIKDSGELSSALGIQDASALTVDETKSFTRIGGSVQIVEEDPTKKDEDWFSSGKRIVILAFGGLLVLTLGYCGISRKYGSKKPSAYLAKMKQKDRINQDQLLPTTIKTNSQAANRHITFNPLSDGL